MMWLLVFVGFVASSASPASTLCEIELSPTKVVVEYGGSFSVNCSSTLDQIDGMGWESPQGGRGFTTNVSLLALDVDSVALWTISALCYITLLDSKQCSEHLPITVYKTPDSVTMPQPSKTGPMVEGEKYRVQCDVAAVAPARNLVVRWHKGNKIVSVDEQDHASASPVNVSSTLELTAHRDDDGAPIWCEAALSFSPAGPQLPPMQSASREVIVLYPPTFDELENETLEVPAVGEIILNCNATGNPLPAYSWRCPEPVRPAEHKGKENQLTLTRPLQFPGTYTCMASNSQGTATKHFTLIEAPRNRSTLAAIVGVVAFLGAVLLLAGLFFVTPQGTFSLNKGSYLRGQPTSSGPLQEVTSSAENL